MNKQMVTCKTCEHEKKEYYEQPCMSCADKVDFGKWEVKSEEKIILRIPLSEFNISTLVDRETFKTRIYMDGNKILKYLDDYAIQEIPDKYRMHINMLRERMKGVDVL